MINVIWFSLIIPLVFIPLTILFFLKIFKKSHQGHTEYNDNYYEDDDERRRRDQRRRDEEEEEKREEDEYYRR